MKEQFLQIAHHYQDSAILGAAAELGLFPALRKLTVPTAENLATALNADLRGLTMLLDALAALGILEKTNETYEIPDDCQPFLDENSPQSMLPFLCHSMSCLRRWSQLAWTVKSGMPAPALTSLNGAAAEQEAFILGMNSIAVQMIPGLMAQMREAGLLEFQNFLDLGGASGTYAAAFLREIPTAKATIFDLPSVIPSARKRMAEEGLSDRISFVGGDFYRQNFPTGFDFLWVSAIIHQHDDSATELMLQKAFDALESGGRVAIRDVFCAPDRTSPLPAALFAINMLCATQTGKVYSQEEVFDLLTRTGFLNPRLAVASPGMGSVITAEKP